MKKNKKEYYTIKIPKIKLNDEAKCVISIFSVLLLIGIAIATMLGISDSNYGSCHRPLKRVEKVFPFYRLGCWLGEENEK